MKKGIERREFRKLAASEASSSLRARGAPGGQDPRRTTTSSSRCPHTLGLKVGSRSVLASCGAKEYPISKWPVTEEIKG
jgi:hypothetical protein